MQNYGHRGFYKTPVSKCILGGVFLSSCALNVPIFSHLRHVVVCSTHSIFKSREAWRLLTRNLAFLDIKDLLCCCLLIYHLRVFEKRLGSRKFSSHLLGKLLLTTLLELLFAFVCNNFFDFEVSFLASGPYALIFPLFINFYYEIPRVTYSHILGVPITGKSFIYLIGLQVLSDSLPSLTSGICCLVAGILHHKNIFGIQQYIRIPEIISNIAEKSIGTFFASSPPRNINMMMGATLELQRQEIVDAMEQASISQQLRQFSNVRRQQRGQGYAETLVNSSNGSDNSGFGFQWLRRRPPPPPSDEMVNTLIGMGFNRQSAVAALRSSNNDLTAATAILLNES